MIGSQPLFVLGAELSGSRRMKAGEYAFPSRASVAQVIALIASGKVVRKLLASQWTEAGAANIDERPAPATS